MRFLLAAFLGVPLLSGSIVRSDSGEPGGLFLCSIQCYQGCSIGGGTGHYTSATGGYGGGVHHSSCMAGDSCEAHTCGGKTLRIPGVLESVPGKEAAVASVLAFAEAAANGSVEAAMTLRRDFGQSVELNADRRALQILGCNSNAIAVHVPLNDTQMTALAAE